MSNQIILPNELINHILSFRPTHPIITKNFISEIIRGYNRWTDEEEDKTYVSFSNFVLNITACDGLPSKSSYLEAYSDKDTLQGLFLKAEGGYRVIIN
jgi:hypothetical protein